MEKLKASDLRCGNYVNYLDEVIQIANISRTDKLEGVTPIKLTEDWLIRFGFDSNPYDDTYLKGFGLDGLMTIHCDKTQGKLILWEDRTSVILKTVHQLQNLWYVLIQEELTIKTD